MNKITEDGLDFSLNFTYPSQVSIGLIKDLLVAEIINPAFFSSVNSQASIENGIKITKRLDQVIQDEAIL